MRHSETMRVGVDISALALTRAGTARYLQELLPRLHHRVDLVQLAFGGSGRVTAAVRDAAWYPLGLPRRARCAGIDLLHCPTFRAPFRPPVPLVVTVFDLAILRYPEAFNRWTRTYSRFFVPRAVGAAARVITISDFTRREVTELLGVPEERIRVIPLAAGDAFGTAGAAADGDYVLAVGTLEPRKNLARLAEGARRAGLELRVVGARGWGGVQADGAGVRWLGHVPDAELAALYRGALCVAYPSLYEGFGLPVLEAMACGAPVVTSRGSATEEVADGAAVLVDPADPASIAAGLEEAIGRREELARLGRERAAGYSWDRVAEADRGRVPGGSRECARPDRCRRPRPRAHGRGDVRREPPSRAAGAHGRVRVRRRHTPSRADPARSRGSPTPRTEPGAAHGLDAPAAHATRGPRSGPFPARDTAPLSLPRRRHHPRPLVRARARSCSGRRTASCSGGSCRAQRARRCG